VAGARAYPFRLGTTSYIIPDDILPNVRFLAPLVDDVELVLFESPDVSNIPSAATVSELAAIAADNDLTYTVHFPTDCRAGAESSAERERFLDGVRRIIDRCRPLQPRAWVMHLEGVDSGDDGSRVLTWRNHCAEARQRVVGLVGAPRAVAIENLEYPWQWHEQLTVETGASLCCDIGHLWVNCPDSWREQAAAMLPAVSVIHLHGVQGTADHLSLARGSAADQRLFLQAVGALPYQGVLTLEIFNEQDFGESLRRVAELWEA